MSERAAAQVLAAEAREQPASSFYSRRTCRSRSTAYDDPVRGLAIAVVDLATLRGVPHGVHVARIRRGRRSLRLPPPGVPRAVSARSALVPVGPLATAHNEPCPPPARVVIVGGGPGGYEAALVAAQLGAEVTIVDTDGLGGSAVLTDCVPSKTLIATAELMTEVGGCRRARRHLTDQSVGRRSRDPASTSTSPGSTPGSSSSPRTSPTTSRAGWRRRACASSAAAAGSTAPTGSWSSTPDGSESALEADAVLLATGAAPRTLPSAQPDGERILTWEQVYDLTELPAHLIVVGSGVTGAEFASAYIALGAEVTLVSSRDRVLPGEDADAAAVLEEVFTRRGMHVLARSRMESVTRCATPSRSR